MSTVCLSEKLDSSKNVHSSVDVQDILHLQGPVKNKSLDFSQPLGIAFIHGFYSKMPLRFP